MGEGVATAPAGDDQPRRGDLVERVEQVARGPVAGLGEHLEVEAQADGGREGQHVARGRGQAREPAVDHLADPGGRPLGRAVALLLVEQQLLQEERVAARALAVARRGADIDRSPREQGGDRVVVEPGQHLVQQRPGAPQLRQRVGGRGGQLVLPRGDEQQQPAAHERLAEVAQQRRGVRVGPVEVLEDEQHRSRGGGVLEQASHRLEGEVARAGAVLGRSAVAAGRQQPRQRPVVGGQPVVGLVGRQLAEQRLERLHPGLVGHQGLLVAAPVQDGGTGGVDPARQLAGQRRLADPGLSAHHGDPRVAAERVVPGVLKPVERRSAALGRDRARQCRRERRWAGRLRRARADPSAAHVLDERAGLGRGRHAELAAQPVGQRRRRRQRRRTVAGAREQADQLAMCLLAERLGLQPPARPAGRRAQLACGLGLRGERREHARELCRVLVAGAQHPVGVHAGEQLAHPAVDGRRQLAGGRVPPELPQVGAHARRVEPDLVARGDDGVAAGRAERATQLVDGVAQRLAGALLADVRPQTARERRARVRSWRDHEPGEQLVGPGVGGELHRPPVEVRGQAAEDANFEHGASLALAECMRRSFSSVVPPPTVARRHPAAVGSRGVEVGGRLARRARLRTHADPLASRRRSRLRLRLDPGFA